MNKISSCFIFFWILWDQTMQCSTFGYCFTGINTLSESFMFLLLMTSRYFFSSSSFFPSEPWNFSISEKKNHKKTTISEMGSHCKIWWLLLLPFLRLWRILIKGLKQHHVNSYMNAATDVIGPLPIKTKMG